MDNMTFTENGARTFKTTESAVLDFFSRGAALREVDDDKIVDLFERAMQENPLLAMKTLFYIRDIRGGQGERKTFRTLWKYVFTNYRDWFKANYQNVVLYGRWDDLWKDVPLCDETISLIKKAIDSGDNLLYKWLPSENTSSKETRHLATWIRTALRMTSRQYRKMLSEGRARGKVVETFMSDNRWKEINYSQVPSQASKNYRKAFDKHDSERYSEFIDKAVKGEVKIHSDTLYPYDIVRKYLINESGRDSTLEALWNQLPDYVNGDFNAIVMADVSGSMTSNDQLPLAVSVSLALYFAERNKNAGFHNKFMTFSDRPSLVEIKGKSLYDRIRSISQADWEMNTNLLAAFKLLLKTAKENNTPVEEMPKKLFIVSDMEFDSSVETYSMRRGDQYTNYEAVRKLYKESGYELPQVIFWNVNARGEQSPVRMNQEGVALVSGCSPSTFKYILSSNALTPYDLMIQVLENERYNKVVDPR